MLQGEIAEQRARGHRLGEDHQVERGAELGDLRQHAADLLEIGGIVALAGADLGDGETRHGIKDKREKTVEGGRGFRYLCRRRWSSPSPALVADASYRFPYGRSLFMGVNLLNDDQRRRIGTHLRLLVSDLDTLAQSPELERDAAGFATVRDAIAVARRSADGLRT